MIMLKIDSIPNTSINFILPLALHAPLAPVADLMCTSKLMTCVHVTNQC